MQQVAGFVRRFSPCICQQMKSLPNAPAAAPGRWRPRPLKPASPGVDCSSDVRAATATRRARSQVAEPRARSGKCEAALASVRLHAGAVLPAQADRTGRTRLVRDRTFVAHGSPAVDDTGAERARCGSPGRIRHRRSRSNRAGHRPRSDPSRTSFACCNSPGFVRSMLARRISATQMESASRLAPSTSRR